MLAPVKASLWPLSQPMWPGSFPRSGVVFQTQSRWVRDFEAFNLVAGVGNWMPVTITDRHGFGNVSTRHYVRKLITMYDAGILQKKFMDEKFYTKPILGDFFWGHKVLNQ